MQAVEMREKQINIRLSEEEAERLDLVANHYGLNVSGLLRMLIKREVDAIAPSESTTEKYAEEHEAVLNAIKSLSSERGRIAAAKLHHRDFQQAVRDEAKGTEADFAGGVNRIVNELVRWGYLRRVKSNVTGVITYVLTPKA